MLNSFIVSLGGAILLVLFSTREVVSNPPTFRLYCVTLAYIFTSSVLNNQGNVTFGGAIRSNKFLYGERYV